VPKLSDTRYLAKGTKWRWRYVGCISPSPSDVSFKSYSQKSFLRTYKNESFIFFVSPGTYEKQLLERASSVTGRQL